MSVTGIAWTAASAEVVRGVWVAEFLTTGVGGGSGGEV